MLRRAVQLNPKSPPAHNNLGVLYFNKGMIEDAVGEFSAVVPRDYARVLSIIRQAEENGQQS